MENDLFGELWKQMEYAHLYKTHPNFDKYPEYMKSALITNEILQGRVKKPTPTK